MDNEQLKIIAYIFGLCDCSFTNMVAGLNSIVEQPEGEYRLNGNLGFGGKFWWNHRASRYYVNTYKEDETKERLELIEKINHILNSL